jgi:hypothetical protein
VGDAKLLNMDKPVAVHTDDGQTDLKLPTFTFNDEYEETDTEDTGNIHIKSGQDIVIENTNHQLASADNPYFDMSPRECDDGNLQIQGGQLHK